MRKSWIEKDQAEDYNELYFILKEKEQEIEKMKKNLEILKKQHRVTVWKDDLDSYMESVDIKNEPREFLRSTLL